MYKRIVHYYSAATQVSQSMNAIVCMHAQNTTSAEPIAREERFNNRCFEYEGLRFLATRFLKSCIHACMLKIL